MPYLLSCNGAAALLAGRTSDSMQLDARHSHSRTLAVAFQGARNVGRAQALNASRSPVASC